MSSLSALGLPPGVHVFNCMMTDWALVLLGWVLASLVKWTRGHRVLRHRADGYMRW